MGGSGFQMNGMCYWTSTSDGNGVSGYDGDFTQGTFEECLAYCESWGATLATFFSDEDREAMKTYIMDTEEVSSGLYYCGYYSQDHWAWVGEPTNDYLPYVDGPRSGC